MRLSDIKGEETFEVLADLVEPIISIAQDDAAARMFQREKCPKGMTPRDFALEKIKVGLPTLLRGHKDDLIVIIATLKRIPPEQYASEVGLASLAKDVLELASDEDFLGFLS